MAAQAAIQPRPELVSGADAELAERARQVILDRGRGQERLPGDLLGGQPGAGQVGDLPFPVCQLVRLGHRGDLAARRVEVGDRERDGVVERRRAAAGEQRVELVPEGRAAVRDRAGMHLLEGRGAASRPPARAHSASAAPSSQAARS